MLFNLHYEVRSHCYLILIQLQIHHLVSTCLKRITPVSYWIYMQFSPDLPQFEIPIEST
jgi:hypothetical protein